MKISDEIRKWCDEADVDGNACDELCELADRIDREMVELPKDADGVPIHVGDTVYYTEGDLLMHVRVMSLNETWHISPAETTKDCVESPTSWRVGAKS